MITTDNFLCWRILKHVYLLLTLSHCSYWSPQKARINNYYSLHYNQLFFLEYDCLLLQLNLACKRIRTQNSTTASEIIFKIESRPYILRSCRLWNCVYHTFPRPQRFPVFLIGILPFSKETCLLKTHNATRMQIRWNYCIRSQKAAVRWLIGILRTKSTFSIHKTYLNDKIN